MQIKATIQKRGTIAIPAPIRNALKLKEGDELYFDIKDADITLTRHKEEQE